ncbi:MAG: deoxyribose-phosphate aldolase [Clostridia bacterium]|nr:deoxyribose-phosphate aldolase [Clostridia bacterium]MBQ9774247.1 deoxyribose-phosphate aldolase [Clostridia bacterium]
MGIQEILSHCDHTLLLQGATWEEVRALCDDGMRYGTASVCISPCYVRRAKAYVGDRLRICTVVGFPNGDSTTAVKCFEAAEALREGADEIDMVIHVGDLKAGNDEAILEEIRAVKAVCGAHILKVIIETCLLTDAEKLRMCRIVSASGADYIKTSTGFSTAGATREDVRLMCENVAAHVKVKAAGGIASLQDAEDFLKLGADRLGTSRIVKIVKNGEDPDNRKEY